MIRCNRCNKPQHTPAKCDMIDCANPGYFDVMKTRFPNGMPAKCYCTVVGGINAGKTYYLMCLVEELRNPGPDTEILLSKLGIASLEMIDPDSQNLYYDLIETSRQGGRIGTFKGPVGSFSLIITLEQGKSYEIVLFNSSGEKNEEEVIKRKYKTDAHEMKGTVSLCFIDPREDSGLNNILDNPKQSGSVNFDFADHFHKVMQQENRNVQIVNTPLAICISKFDLLMHRIPYELPLAPFIEATNKKFFKDIKNTSEQLKAFLQNRSKTVKPNSLDNKFKNVSYFAIAPFGSDEQPYWDNRDPKGILAPFFWVLKAQNILKDNNGLH